MSLYIINKYVVLYVIYKFWQLKRGWSVHLLLNLVHVILIFQNSKTFSPIFWKYAHRKFWKIFEKMFERTTVSLTLQSSIQNPAKYLRWIVLLRTLCNYSKFRGQRTAEDYQSMLVTIVELRKFLEWNLLHCKNYTIFVGVGNLNYQHRYTFLTSPKVTQSSGCKKWI